MVFLAQCPFYFQTGVLVPVCVCVRARVQHSWPLEPKW